MKDYLVIEKLNEDYLNEYRSNKSYYGNIVLKMRNSLKSFRLISFFKYFIKLFKKNRFGNANENNDFLNLGLDIKYIGKKIAIYTCVTGGYDKIMSPYFIEDNVDYFIFSDRNIHDEIWVKLDIPEKLKSFDNSTINRYIKMHPFEFFPDYDYVMYVDGNVKVVGNIYELLPIVDNSILNIGMHKHYSRNCIYDESKECIRLKKGNKASIISQMEKYKQLGFPKKFGMFEATIIISKKCDKSVSFFNQWWDEYLESYSKRDQLALPFVLWKNGYTINDFGVLGTNEYKNPKFRIYSH